MQPFTVNYLKASTERGAIKKLLSLQARYSKSYQVVSIYENKKGETVIWYYSPISEVPLKDKENDQ